MLKKKSEFCKHFSVVEDDYLRFFRSMDRG